VSPNPVRRLFTRRRLQRLSGVASAQLVVQAIGFAAGIVLVREMELAQYGYYTLAISMVGLGNVLVDLGLGTAVLALGGRIGFERARIAALLGDALALQRRLLLWGGALLLPAFAAMFFHQGLAPLPVAALSLLVIACVGLNARNQVCLSVLRLHGDPMLQQRIEIGVNLGKLMLVLLAVLIYIDAQVAVVANLIAAIAMFALLLHHLNRQLGLDAVATRDNAAQLRSFVRQQAPNSLYYCVSGQIAIWLIGLFGGPDRVAQAGALGRLALFFTLIGAVVTALVQPWFARTTDKRELLSGFVALNLFFVALTALLIGIAEFAPGALLWILGPRYASLVDELVWMVLAASLAGWSGAVYAVSAARGWVVPSALVIPMGVSTLALAAWLLDMSSVAGGFMMNTATAGMATALTIAFGAFKLLRSPAPPGAAA
jgi:O-antigen/teichoic acid export membrane protein